MTYALQSVSFSNKETNLAVTILNILRHFQTDRVVTDIKTIHVSTPGFKYLQKLTSPKPIYNL